MGNASLRVDFDECQIRFVIAGNVVGVVGFAVVRRHVNLQVRGALDHVLIGHDVARRIDNETGAETLQRLANFARPDCGYSRRIARKILKRIAHCASNYALGIDVNYCRQHLRYRQNSRFRSRVGLCKTRWRSARSIRQRSASSPSAGYTVS